MSDKKLEELEGRIKALEDKANAEPNAIGEAPVVDDSETFRYHEKHPKGKKFKTSEIGQLGKDWKDSPAKLEK